MSMSVGQFKKFLEANKIPDEALLQSYNTTTKIGFPITNVQSRMGLGFIQLRGEWNGD